MKNFKTFLKEKESGNITVFDLDDCLIFSTSKIRYKIPKGDWQESTTSDWVNVRTKLPKGTEYDFSDFEDFNKTVQSISGEKPNMKVMKELDKAVNSGDKIGILTARGNQRAVLLGLKSILIYKNANGELKPIPRAQFRKKYIFAVTDPKFLDQLDVQDKNETSIEQLKALVLQNIFGDTMGFSNITFYDDDPKTIKWIQKLKDTRIKAVKV